VTFDLTKALHDMSLQIHRDREELLTKTLLAYKAEHGRYPDEVWEVIPSGFGGFAEMGTGPRPDDVRLNIWATGVLNAADLLNSKVTP